MVKKSYNFKNDNIEITSAYQEESFHIYSIKNIFQNIDELSIILNVNNQFVEQLSHENNAYLYSIAFIIFIAFIIGLIISIPTSKLYMDYNKVYKKNLRSLLKRVDTHLYKAKESGRNQSISDS